MQAPGTVEVVFQSIVEVQISRPLIAGDRGSGANTSPSSTAMLEPDEAPHDRCIITFGHVGRDGGRLPRKRITSATNFLMTTFGKIFGGGQASEHRGSYLRIDGSIVLEPATSVLAYSTAAKDHLPALVTAARRVAIWLDQEVVYLVIEPVAAVVLKVRSLEFPFADDPGCQLTVLTQPKSHAAGLP